MVFLSRHQYYRICNFLHLNYTIWAKLWKKKSYCWWILLSVCFMFHFLSIAGLVPRGLDCPGPFDSLWSRAAELSVPPPWWLPRPLPPSETVCQKCKHISHIWMLGLGSDPPWRHRPPADVPSAAPAIIIKEVNSSICSEPLTAPPPQPPNPVPHSCIPAQTRTHIHPRLSTSVVVGRGGGI